MRENLNLKMTGFKLSKEDIQIIDEISKLANSDRSKALRGALAFLRDIIPMNVKIKHRIAHYVLQEKEKVSEVQASSMQKALRAKGINWNPAREWTKNFKE